MQPIHYVQFIRFIFNTLSWSEMDLAIDTLPTNNWVQFIFGFSVTRYFFRPTHIRLSQPGKLWHSVRCLDPGSWNESEPSWALCFAHSLSLCKIQTDWSLRPTRNILFMEIIPSRTRGHSCHQESSRVHGRLRKWNWKTSFLFDPRNSNLQP